MSDEMRRPVFDEFSIAELGRAMGDPTQNGGLDSRDRSEAKKAPNPQELLNKHVDFLTAGELEDRHYDEMPPIIHPELSTEAKEESQTLAAIFLPSSFARLFDKLQMAESVPSEHEDSDVEPRDARVTWKRWMLDPEVVEARASRTAVIFRDIGAEVPATAGTAALAETTVQDEETDSTNEEPDGFDESYAPDDFIDPRVVRKAMHTTQKSHFSLDDDDTYVKEFITDVLPMGDKSQIRDLITINLEVGNFGQNLYNAAYMCVAALRPTLVAMQGARTSYIRDGMTINSQTVIINEEADLSPVAAERSIMATLGTLPAAKILERGLLAHDAVALAKAVDPAAADNFITDEAGFHDKAYWELFNAMAVRRPLTFAHDPLNRPSGFMYAGLNVTAIRATAYGTNPSEYTQAFDHVSQQADLSFGPEFLEMLEAVHDRLPDADAQAAFIRELAECINAAQEDYGTQMVNNSNVTDSQLEQYFNGTRSQVVKPFSLGPTILVKVEPEPGDADTSQSSETTEEAEPKPEYKPVVDLNNPATYTVPYIEAATFVEDEFKIIDEKAYNQRMARIEAAALAYRRLMYRTKTDVVIEVADIFPTLRDGHSSFTDVEQERLIIEE